MKFVLFAVMVFASNYASAVCSQSSAKLEQVNNIQCEEDTGTKEFVFTYSSSTKKNLYVSYVMESCAGPGITAQLFWLTLDASGAIIDSKDITTDKDFVALAGKKHAFKAVVPNLQDCYFYDLNFGISE
jgi:hypothetical protein